MLSAEANVLGLDASTPAVAACALRVDGRAFEHMPPAAAMERRPAHGRELMPALLAAMGEAGLGFADLDLIAVSRGPGSFTGVRIAVATARGLADAHGTTVRGVTSLRALAAGVDLPEGSEPTPGVLAVLDARRGEVFAALYRAGEECWAPRAVSPEALAQSVEALPRPPLAVGSGSLRFRAMLEAAGARVAPEGAPVHAVRALWVCRLALAAPEASAEPAAPLYLRDPDARPLP